MIDSYNTKTKAEYDQYSLALLEASVEIPLVYDEESEPPAIVVMVRNGVQTITCNSLETLRRSISELHLPLDSLCERSPVEVAEIVSGLRGGARVVRNSPLFQFLQQESGIDLDELVPKVVGTALVWHELCGIDLKLVRRKLSTKTMELLE